MPFPTAPSTQAKSREGMIPSAAQRDVANQPVGKIYIPTPAVRDLLLYPNAKPVSGMGREWINPLPFTVMRACDRNGKRVT